MSELSAVERRALARRQRLQKNATERMEQLFTGSGLTPPIEPLPSSITNEGDPQTPTTNSNEEKTKVETKEVEIAEPKIENKITKEKPKEQTTTPVTKRAADESLIQLKREATESIKNAKKASKQSFFMDISITIRLFTAMICGFIYIFLNYDETVIFSLLSIDILIVFISILRPNKQSKGQFEIPIFVKLHRMRAILRQFFSCISVYSTFMISAVLYCSLIVEE